MTSLSRRRRKKPKKYEPRRGVCPSVACLLEVADGLQDPGLAAGDFLDALLGGCDDGVVGVVVLLEAQGLAV